MDGRGGGGGECGREKSAVYERSFLYCPYDLIRFSYFIFFHLERSKNYSVVQLLRTSQKVTGNG